MNNKLNLTTVLGWGSADVKTLEEHIECAEHWGISIEKIVNEIGALGLDVTDINSWFYTSISLTFLAVMNETERFIKENYDDDRYDILIDVIEELKYNYSPHINFMCSCHDNVLDDIDLLQARDEVIKEIIDYLIEEAGLGS